MLFEALEPRLALATILVTRMDDAVGAGDGVTLREAILAANTNAAVDGSAAGEAAPAMDTIVFAAGLSGTISLGAGGQLSINETVVIRGNGASATIIDAQGASRGFFVRSTAGDVTLDGITITNGRDTAGPGGGIRSETPGTLRIENCALLKNRAEGSSPRGGGVSSAGPVVVTNSTISENSVLNGGQFAAHLGGGIYGNSSVVVTNSTISRNLVSGFGQGGGIHADGPVTIHQSTISLNSVVSAVQNGTVQGGGILSGGAVVITDSTISGNSALAPSGSGNGGGIASGSAGLTVIQSTITGNSISGNGKGGGLYGGIGGVVVRNSIIAQNTDTDGSDPDISAGGILAQKSLIGDNSGTGLTASATPDANGNIIGGTGAARIDPLLGPLTLNGGTTKTHALLAGSPAIDGGSNDLAKAPGPDGISGNGDDENITTDQRGNPFARIVNGRPAQGATIVDMGAYELQTVAGLSLVVDTAVDENDGDYSLGDLSLREAIGLANGSFGADQITFAPAIDGQPILLTLGQLEISETVTIKGNGAGNTIIDGQLQSRVFDVLATGGDVTFERVTIRNGKTTAIDGDGGGIRSNSSGTLTIQNSVVTGNSTAVLGDGGGIYSSGPIFVVGSTVSNNASFGGSAGGISAGDVATVVNSTIHANFSDGHSGGGGGILSVGSLTVTNSTISGNGSSGHSGGGGILSNGSLTVTNSTISGNGSLGTGIGGGGVLVFGALALINSTVVSNVTTGRGGGLLTFGAVTIQNSIVAQNVDIQDGSRPDLSQLQGESPNIQFSLIGDNSGTGLTPSATPDPVTGNIVGTSTAKIDPKLGPLTFNGGTTKTHALLAGSPAIDSGSNDLAKTPGPNGIPGDGDDVPLTTDQRGAPFNRAAGVKVDMGAYEQQTIPGLVFQVSTAVDEIDGDITGGDLSLREAIGLANGNFGADEITLDPTLDDLALLLTLGQLEISETVKITGNGAGNSIIDAQQRSRVFDILATAGDATFDGVTVKNGVGTKGATLFGGGGGIRSQSAGRLMVARSTIEGNSAIEFARGGGIYADGSVTVTSSTITGNTTDQYGGGIFAVGEATVINSTITGNTAGLSGGAVASDILVDVIGSTITDNTASNGGGISAFFMQIHNSIVAGNRDTEDGSTPEIEIGSSFIVVRASLIGDNNGTNLAASATPDPKGNLIGTHAMPIDPKLGPLADNGGPTQTHALLLDSPAIDRGDNNLAKDAGPNGIFGDADDMPLANDQRGAPFNRIIGGRVDMGAFELRALVVNTSADENDPTFDETDLSLREALAEANGSTEPYTIVFAPALNGQTITLSLGELLVTKSVTILGPGADKLAISGGAGATQSRVFDFDGSGANSYSLSGVTVKNGNGVGAGSGFGGAIRFKGADDELLIENCVIRDSSAVIDGTVGGGLFADEGRVELRNVTVTNNVAEFGGGLGFLEVRGLLTNVTVSGNMANTRGGGIVQFASRTDGVSQLALLNSTVTANISAVASGIRNSTQNAAFESTVFLGNTIVANNTGGGLQFVNAGTNASIFSLGNNISSDGTGDLFQASDKPNTNPMLGALANNGSPIPTHAVPFGSPAHNAGDNALAVTAGPDGTLFTADDLPLVGDARGAPRVYPSDGAVDIGAFEFVPNQAPSFSTPAFLVATDEDEASSISNWATSILPGLAIETGQVLTFDVSVPPEQQGLFDVLPAIDANGRLTFTPKPNMKGDVTVSVVLRDNGGMADGGDDASEMQTFTIFINKPHPWHNSSAGAFGSLDVNGKDGITLLDAVAVINYLNSAPPAGQGDVPASAFSAPVGLPLVGYIDVVISGQSGNFISVLDALAVINFLNTPGGEGEGERGQGTGVISQESVASSQGSQGLESLLALLAADQAVRRRRGR